MLTTDLFQWADVIHLHNLHGRYFDYHLLPEMSAAKPVVWTLHDMWALTGHCSYSYDCARWKTGCYSCPLLQGANRQLVEPHPTCVDRTRSIWHRKRRLYGQSRINIAAPSRWLADLVHESILSHAQTVECIPNGVDLDAFRPADQARARACLNLPTGAKVIVFVAEKLANQRKGYVLLLEALDRLQVSEPIVLLTIGTPESRELLGRFQSRELGRLDDEGLLGLAYSAADVYVLPTLADNQPLVLIESLACGTPIVSFNVGGVPEMVRHMEVGFLARERDVDHLAHGISVLLGDDELRFRMRERCRQIAVAEYGLDLQTERYISLYQRAIASAKQGAQNGL
jgi:glycosyltransferase involved in cell wall biosynthesis